MIEIFSTIPVLLLNSVLFHTFVKIADLLDEHGLKLFKYADILFGFLSGIALSLVVSFNSILASFYFAYLLSMLLRGRVDYMNHRIAAVIILFSIVFSGMGAKIDWTLFFVTFLLFTIPGLLTDYNIIKKNIVTKTQLYVYIGLIVMMYLNINYWIALASYFLGAIAYQSVKLWGKKHLPNY